MSDALSEVSAPARLFASGELSAFVRTRSAFWKRPDWTGQETWTGNGGNSQSPQHSEVRKAS